MVLRQWSVHISLVLFVSAFALCGVGCAGNPDGAAFRPEFIESDEGVLYIYRLPQQFAGESVRIVLNQVTLGELGPGEYVSHILPPGRHIVRAERGMNDTIGVDVASGESVYVQVEFSAFDRRPQLTQPQTVMARERLVQSVRVETGDGGS